MEVSFRYTARQIDAVRFLRDDKTTEVLFGGAAGGGKSAFGCAWLMGNALNPDYAGTRWLMGRSELKTLKETTLNTFFQVAAMLHMKAGNHYRLNQQSGVIYFPKTGSEILLKDLKSYPSDPNFDSLGSLEITGAFIDEVNQISEKAKNIVKSRIRYKLDEYGLHPKMLMTCNPAKNWTYSQFYKPHKEGNLAADRAFVQSFVSDNPHISKHYVSNLQTLDKASKERLLYGNWNYDNDPSALIPFDKITDLFSNTHVESGTPALTCDAARFGGDKAKIAVWQGFRLAHWVSIDKCSMVELAAKIVVLMDRFQVPASRVVIDDDGVGGGCVDVLKEIHKKPVRGFNANARPIDERIPTPQKGTTTTPTPPNYVNLKAQCCFRLAKRVNESGYYLDPDVLGTEEVAAMTEEMEQIKQRHMDKDVKLAVIPKDEIKLLLGRSPDSSDTVMLRELLELKQQPVLKAC